LYQDPRWKEGTYRLFSHPSLPSCHTRLDLLPPTPSVPSSEDRHRTEEEESTDRSSESFVRQSSSSENRQTGHGRCPYRCRMAGRRFAIRSGLERSMVSKAAQRRIKGPDSQRTNERMQKPAGDRRTKNGHKHKKQDTHSHPPNATHPPQP
jgi:hypothetical protein